ncbi:MAG: hypothetical protein IJW00_11130 [Clostridia bacterium]|nr:hypothetical protein [Clostridia bacterium]MBQ9781479.1 hypothetical protein [Clostridia bacterium]
MKNDKEKTSMTAENTSPAVVHNEADTLAKKKKAKRWTVVDTVILLMILLALGGVILRGVVDWRKETVTPASGPYYVDFSVTEINPTVLAEISPFDPLYLYETGELVGYVGVYDDGTMALRLLSPSVMTANGGVAAEGCMVCLEGVYQNGSLLVTGMDTYLTSGSRLTLRTDRAVILVEITAIREGA